MGEFEVKLAVGKACASDLGVFQNRTQTVRTGVRRVKNNLRWKVKRKEDINRRLQEILDRLGEERQALQNASVVLNNVIDHYEETERLLLGEKGAKTQKDYIEEAVERMNHRTPGEQPDSSWRDGLPIIYFPMWPIPGGIPTGPEAWNTISILDYLFNYGDNDKDSKNGEWQLNFEKDENKSKKFTGEYKLDKDKKTNIKSVDDFNEKFDKYKKDHSKKIGETKKIYDFKTKKTTDYDTTDISDQTEKDRLDAEWKKETAKPDVDVKLYEKTYGGSKSVLHNEDSIGDKNGTHASYEADVFKRDAHASMYAGVLGAGGSLGASFSAFTATEEAQLGSDMLGVYAKATETVGRVGGEVEASAGLLNKDGKIDPNIYVGGSIEAIAGEITGEVGAKILGTDVGVKGSLNYGLGAHANVGIKDGKLSLDIGATLGVGGSVSIEVDMSGTVDAVCDFAQSAYEGIEEAGKAVAEGAKKAADAIGEGMEAAGNAINEGLRNIGEGISKWFG